MIRATVVALLSTLLIAIPAQAAAPKQPQKKHQIQKKERRGKKPVQRQAKPDQSQSRQDRGLLKLDLNTRIEQRCNDRACSDVIDIYYLLSFENTISLFPKRLSICL